MASTVDKAAPHDDAAIRLHRLSQHIRTVGMCALVVERTWLALAVGFHQEASEVGYQCINLLCLRLPPSLNLGVQGVGGLDRPAAVESFSGDSHWGGEVNRQIDLDAVRTENIGNLLYLIKIYSAEHLWRGVHIVQHRTIDANGGVSAGIFLDQTGIYGLRLVTVKVPENTESGIAAFYAAIKVVPMVQNPIFEEWFLDNSCLLTPVSCLLSPQQRICPIEQSTLATSTDAYPTIFLTDSVCLLGNVGID